MSRLALIRQLWRHSAWADDELARAVRATPDPPAEAWREYLHILGAEEVWLSRLEQRASRYPVWPTLSRDEGFAFQATLARELAAYCDRLTEAELDRVVSYRTTDGRPFDNTVGDILSHVALHGQYHRGKVNLLLRQSDLAPGPVDFITFVRGAPTATEASAAAAAAARDAR